MKVNSAHTLSNYRSQHVDRSQPTESSGFSGVLEGVQKLASFGTSLLRQVVPGASLLVGDPKSEQFDHMWEMQRENQSFNMEYLELQSAMQEDNRRYSTLSNLMKARHDTAKSAINNMHV